ncbi:MAG: PadR family transcriptional regulator [Gemmatimonadota bacterium]|nr:PadR family transcriptional regulator [Gemmatimonadota bacterium]
MARRPIDLMHGTLDVLVLKTISWQPAHGYAITQPNEERTGGVFEIEDAALYKALHRLEASGAVSSVWGASENNRRARYYRLTTLGRKELRAETSTWHQYAAAVTSVLGTA